MGTLVCFELKKIWDNRAGMVACALVLAMLTAVGVANLCTMETTDTKTGRLVRGMEAQQAYRHTQESHAGTLDDERVAADAAVFDRADALVQQTPGVLEMTGEEIVNTYGLSFWQETMGIIDQSFYMEVVGTLDSLNPRAKSLEEGARARVDGALEMGFWGYFDYSDEEKAYWHQMADEILWPVEWGYVGGWHYVLGWRGFAGLAVVAVCIALSGVFAGEYQERTVAVVLPTRHGRRALPMSKAIASLLFTTGYWLVLVVTILGMHLTLYGTDGWNLPLQVTFGLDNPYPLTIGQAVLVSYVLGYLVALGMSALTLLLSSALRSPLPVAAISMAVVFVGVIALFSTPLAKLALLTPFSGLSYVFDAMVSYAAGPVVVGLPLAMVVLYGLMLTVSIPLSMCVFKRHQVA